jgi:hypothetical protein
MMRTRLIELAAGQDRERADNRRTAAAIGPVASRGRRPSAVERLRALWPAVHRAIPIDVGPGVAVIAVDTTRDRVAGSMWIAGKPGAINVGVIGRHGQCDLYLDGDDRLSLRHLAVVVEPVADWGGPGGTEARYRLLDLRTSAAFTDEDGRALEAITALGPAFVLVGRHVFYCLPTGVEDWPHDPDAALAAMPERIYIDDRGAEPDRWQRRRAADLASGSQLVAVGRPAHGSASRTIVTAVPGPSRARLAAGANDDDPPLGRLELSSALGADVIEVGVDAARRGVLLGRYHRCDTLGARSLALDRISRVHGLVITIDDVPWLVDVASTNGVRADGAPTRVAALAADVSYELGGVGALRWVPDTST